MKNRSKSIVSVLFQDKVWKQKKRVGRFDNLDLVNINLSAKKLGLCTHAVVIQRSSSFTTAVSAYQFVLEILRRNKIWISIKDHNSISIGNKLTNLCLRNNANELSWYQYI